MEVGKEEKRRSVEKRREEGKDGVEAVDGEGKLMATEGRKR